MTPDLRALADPLSTADMRMLANILPSILRSDDWKQDVCAWANSTAAALRSAADQLDAKDAIIKQVADNIHGSPATIVEWSVQVGEALVKTDAQKYKAMRFDLDQLGIEHREREAVELVELRAKVAAQKAEIERLKLTIKRINSDIIEG